MAINWLGIAVSVLQMGAAAYEIFTSGRWPIIIMWASVSIANAAISVQQ